MKNPASRLGLVGTLTAASLVVSGCATKGYVDEHVAAVASRVAALEGRVDGVDKTAQEALQSANAANALAATKAPAKFAYEDLNQGTSVQFATNKWSLSPEAQATLTEFATKLRSDNKFVYLELVGHGDPRGTVNQNRLLGRLRVAEVSRFLYGQGIPLNRMDVVSWGEEKVANAKDTSSEALQQSRRVDIIVRG